MSREGGRRKRAWSGSGGNDVGLTSGYSIWTYCTLNAEPPLTDVSCKGILSHDVLLVRE